MSEEFNLSELIGTVPFPGEWKNKDFILAANVKRFIEILKEEDNDFYDREIRDQDLDKDEIIEKCFDFMSKRIDKFAGEKFI